MKAFQIKKQEIMRLETAIRERKEEEERDERRKVEEKEKNRRSQIKLKVILALFLYAVIFQLLLSIP